VRGLSPYVNEKEFAQFFNKHLPTFTLFSKMPVRILKSGPAFVNLTQLGQAKELVEQWSGKITMPGSETKLTFKMQGPLPNKFSVSSIL